MVKLFSGNEHYGEITWFGQLAENLAKRYHEHKKNNKKAGVKGGWAIAQSPILNTTITLKRLNVMNYNTQLCNTAWGKKLLAQVAKRTCFY